MSDTYTPFLNLTKPEIGGDPDTWGTLLNGNFDSIDTGVHTASTSASSASTLASAALPKAGGTLTGRLTIAATKDIQFLRPDSAASMYLRAWSNNSNAGVEFVETTDATIVASIDNSGNVLAAGNVSAYSDKRLKTRITRIKDALNKVLALNGVTYNRKDIKGKPRHTGLIAQEVQAVIPEAVTESESGTLSVTYGNLVGLLVEAIKELKSTNDKQNKHISKLEARITSLEEAW